jgi:nitrogen fixation NifU-like protein
MSDLRALYQEVILDHSKNPRNFRVPDPVDHFANGINPLCGDKLTVYLHIVDGIIDDISFEGSGCAISTASASMMTQRLKGQTVEQANAVFEQFHELLTSSVNQETSDDQLGKLSVFSGVREFPMRVKCATLAWHTLQSALSGEQADVSTE